LKDNLPDFESTQLRVKKSKILNDPNLSIAPSTLYKLVKDNEHLELDQDDVVFKRESFNLKKLEKVLLKVYTHYDPKTGQQKIPVTSLFTTEEREDLFPYLKDLEEDYKLVKLSDDTVSFTRKGIMILREEWGWPSGKTIELCGDCLKPLIKDIPVRFSTNLNEYDDIGKHTTCYASGQIEKTHRYELVCAYCNMPLNVARYEYHITSNQFNYLNTIKYHLSKMAPEARDKLVQFALQNFMHNGYEEFKLERERFGEERQAREEEFRQKTEEGTVTRIDEFFLDFSKHRVTDTLDTILEQFFTDFKKGNLFRELDPVEIFRSILDYQLAEYEARVEQKDRIAKEIQRFCEFTGLFPYITRVSTSFGRSPLNSSFPDPWDNCFTAFSDGELFFHPRCLERYQASLNPSTEGGR
jgi:hypothetical protein